MQNDFGLCHVLPEMEDSLREPVISRSTDQFCSIKFSVPLPWFRWDMDKYQFFENYNNDKSIEKIIYKPTLTT